jgi:hypothetical protein
LIYEGRKSVLGMVLAELPKQIKVVSRGHFIRYNGTSIRNPTLV